MTQFEDDNLPGVLLFSKICFPRKYRVSFRDGKLVCLKTKKEDDMGDSCCGTCYLTQACGPVDCSRIFPKQMQGVTVQR